MPQTHREQSLANQKEEPPQKKKSTAWAYRQSELTRLKKFHKGMPTQLACVQTSLSCGASVIELHAQSRHACTDARARLSGARLPASVVSFKCCAKTRKNSTGRDSMCTEKNNAKKKGMGRGKQGKKRKRMRRGIYVPSAWKSALAVQEHKFPFRNYTRVACSSSCFCVRRRMRSFRNMGSKSPKRVAGRSILHLK